MYVLDSASHKMQTRSATRKQEATATSSISPTGVVAVNPVQIIAPQPATAVSEPSRADATGMPVTPQRMARRPVKPAKATPVHLSIQTNLDGLNEGKPNHLNPRKRDPSAPAGRKVPPAGLFDPYSIESLFNGPLTPLPTSIDLEIPPPSSFDAANNIVGPSKRGSKPYSRQTAKKRTASGTKNKNPIGTAGHWVMGSEGTLVERPITPPTGPSRTINKKPRTIEEIQKEQMEKLMRQKMELDARFGSLPDDDEDMDEDDDFSMMIDTSPVRGREAAGPRTLGPEGTMLVDAEKEWVVYGQYKANEQVALAKYQFLRSDSRFTNATEIIE